MLRFLYAPPDGWTPVAAFGGAPKPPPPPNPAPMPDLQDPAVIAAQKKVLSDAAARSGRMSTMLTDTTNSGYSLDKLGLR